MKINLSVTTFLLFSFFLLQPLFAGDRDSSVAAAGEVIRNWKDGRSPDQDSLVLIGLDTGPVGASSLSSFGGETGSETFQPFATLGISRKGDEITLKEAPYLAVPTMKGFRYINLLISSSEMTEEEVEGFEEWLSPWEYENLVWSSLNTGLFISSDRNAVLETLGQSRPEGEARESSYETIDYVTPEFLFVSGWFASVSFGASYFTGGEYVEKRTFEGERLPNSLSGLVSEEEYRQMLYDAHFNFYGSPPEGDAPFPWDSGPWYEKRVRYTMSRQKGQPGITAMVTCWSNSSRHFNAPVDMGPVPDSSAGGELPDFEALKQAVPDLIDVIVSPDRATVFLVTSDRISCFDSRSGRVLKTLFFEKTRYAVRWNRLIMAESALGTYVDAWERVLEH